MTKARNIANLASDGSALADGTINYTDVSGTPTLATVATSGAYADVTGTPTLATVATTGAYADVTGTPAAALPLTGGTLSGGLSVTGTVAATAVTGNGSALTSLTSANLTGALPAISGASLTDLSGTPTGALLYFAASTAPTGFIKANGASLSTTTYADLFAIVAYTYGGSGASFTLPDLRGEFMRGWDDSRGVDGSRAFGSAQNDQVQYHTHYIQSYFGTNGDGSANGRNQGYGSAGPYGNSIPTQTQDGRNGSETRPRNVALLACIKY